MPLLPCPAVNWSAPTLSLFLVPEVERPERGTGQSPAFCAEVRNTGASRLLGAGQVPGRFIRQLNFPTKILSEKLRCAVEGV